ncbi:MAG: class I SAM-dependent methyltransferase [Actinobacteria bacterium]|nr:class I SAM-dependent methyltransferase [Actinomycetota bacterium]
MDAELLDVFDSNAETYDRINTVISLGLDRRWRDWAAREAVQRVGAKVLDACAGTGLTGLRAAELGAEVTLADASQGMLAVAGRRASAAGLRVSTVRADLGAAGDLAIPGGPFDAITMVFGARYLQDPSATIRSLATLLQPGGRFVLLDFVEPDNSLLARTASRYFFRVLPHIASWLAGRRDLYDRLVETTRAMGRREHLVSLMRDADMEVVEVHKMGFGLVAGVIGRTPGPTAFIEESGEAYAGCGAGHS